MIYGFRILHNDRDELLGRSNKRATAVGKVRIAQNNRNIACFGRPQTCTYIYIHWYLVEQDSNQTLFRTDQLLLQILLAKYITLEVCQFEETILAYYRL